MSGIDEQVRTELKVRMFFRIKDLQKVLVERDFVQGDVLFIDEEADTIIDYMTTLENLKNFARVEKVMIAHSIAYLEGVIKLVKGIGLEAFFKDWLGR